MNKIMEEFSEIAEEIEESVKTINQEEIQEKAVEVGVKVEEGRKRKREDEGEKEQSSGDEVDDFVSDKAFELMEKKILQKRFIRERGFKQFISHFKEVNEKRGWKIICEHMPPGRAALVREFYSNMVGRKETQCYMRRKWFSFHRDEIN